MKKIMLFVAVSIVTTVSAQYTPDPECRPSFRNLSNEQPFEDPEPLSHYKTDEIGIHSFQRPSFENDVIRLLDSVYVWHWDTTLNRWQKYERIMELTYDENNRFISEIWQEFTGSEWINTMRLSYSYDVNGNIVSQLYESWNGNWINNQRSLNSYDNRNNRTSRSIQTWNGNYWTNAFNWIYAYDDNDNLLTELIQTVSDTSWNDIILHTYNYNAYNYNISKLEQKWISGNWENEVLDTFSYESDTILIRQLQQQWLGTNWINSMRYTYSYNENSDWTSRLKETWQNDWTNSQWITRTFDAHNNRIGELIQVWEGTWENDYRNLLAYDNNDNRIEYIIQFWDGETWAYYYKDNRTYDPNHFMITLTATEWAENGIDTVLHDSTHYYFHTLLEIPDHQIPRSDITIYPNPCSGSFNILCDRPVNSIEVYSLSGQKVKRLELYSTGGSIHIEVPHLDPGIYLVKLFSGHALIGVKKVVLTGR